MSTMDPIWHYVRPGGEPRGPVTATRIRELLARGDLQETDLAWREGFSEWMPIRGISDLNPVDPIAPIPLSSHHSAPAAQPSVLPSGIAGWMGFAGVVTIVQGVLACLTCFGIPIGIVMIIAGTALVSGRSIALGITRLDPEVMPLLEKLRTFVMLFGIVSLLSLLFVIASLTGVLGMIVSAIAAAASASGGM